MKTDRQLLDEIREVVEDMNAGYLDYACCVHSTGEEAISRIEGLLQKNKETQKNPEQQLLEKISKIFAPIELTNTWFATWENQIEEVQTLLKTHGFIEEKGRDPLG